MKQEVENIMRTQRHFTPQSTGRAPQSATHTPIEIGAFNVGRGAKDGAKGDARKCNMTCWQCGKTGHAAYECRSAPKGDKAGEKGGGGDKDTVKKDGGKKGKK